MKIIIAGSGKVGFTLAEQLVRESHDVTIVDLKEAALRRAADMLDIMAVQGNGVSANVLREAGADSADVRLAICQALHCYTGLGSDRIQVFRMKTD